MLRRRWEEKKLRETAVQKYKGVIHSVVHSFFQQVFGLIDTINSVCHLSFTTKEAFCPHHFSHLIYEAASKNNTDLVL